MKELTYNFMNGLKELSKKYNFNGVLHVDLSPSSFKLFNYYTEFHIHTKAEDFTTIESFNLQNDIETLLTNVKYPANLRYSFTISSNDRIIYKLFNGSYEPRNENKREHGYSYDYDGDLEEYETENFIALMGFDPCPSHLQENQGLLQDIFEEGEVKEHFQIEYDHITKEFAIETDDEYADTEDKILEIRISDPVIDEVYTIIHKELTGKFPKEVPLQNNEDNRVELLQNDYKKLYNHMKDFKVDKVFTKEPSLHFVFMDTATTRYKAAGLYMFAQGFNLGYSPDKQDFTFNTYEAKTELRLKGSLLSRAFQHDEVINHYELHQYEKQDTFKFFKELVDKYIRPSLKSREKIQVDIRLDAGIIDDVKVISYDLILLYRDKKLVGTIQCEKINKTDTTELVKDVNELIVEVVGGRKSPQLRLDKYFTKEEFKQSVIDGIKDEDIVNMFKNANLTKDGDVNDEKVD